VVGDRARKKRNLRSPSAYPCRLPAPVSYPHRAIAGILRTTRAAPGPVIASRRSRRGDLPTKSAPRSGAAAARGTARPAGRIHSPGLASCRSALATPAQHRSSNAPRSSRVRKKDCRRRVRPLAKTSARGPARESELRRVDFSRSRLAQEPGHQEVAAAWGRLLRSVSLAGRAKNESLAWRWASRRDRLGTEKGLF
jgi:hypothetical protein